MAHKVTTKTSYGKRLIDSIKGVGAGLLLFLGGTVLLFWNEGNFVKTKKSIQKAESVLIQVDDVSIVDPSLNGKLIHASAFADTKEPLIDDVFGINETAIAISRSVEYFQYRENEDTQTRDLVGGGQETITTYTYEKVWTSEPINSQRFSDPAYQASNFILTKIESKTELAKNVAFGAYWLPKFAIATIELMHQSVPANANLTEQNIRQLENSLQGDRAATPRVHIQGNVVYFGKSPSSPEIGDVIVTLTKTMPTDISIMAMVKGDTFDEFPTTKNRKFSMVVMGQMSAEEMFAEAYSINEGMRILLLLLGMAAIMFGIGLILGVVPTFFNILPFLGKIVGVATGVISVILGGVWSLIIIAISWLFFRPLIAILLIAIAIVPIWFLKKKGK